MKKWFLRDLPHSQSLRNGARVYVSFVVNAITFILRAVDDEETVENLQKETALHCEKGEGFRLVFY